MCYPCLRSKQGLTPEYRVKPALALKHKPVNENERVEFRAAVEIDDQNEMNVIGHNHVIARSKPRVDFMKVTPKSFHRLAEPR